MGALCAKDGGGIDAKTRQIDDELEREQALRNSVHKILLLGMAESGKSTIVKQMNLLYKGGYTPQQKTVFKKAVQASTYQAMRTLIRACENFDIMIKSKQARGLASDFDNAVCDSFTSDLASSVTTLWKDPGIQKAYSRKAELELSDSTEYLITNAERFASPDYIPSDMDILRARIPTTGIVDVEFELDSCKFSVVDVAGQRSEKKRWIHYFEDVKAVVFVSSLADFDQFNADNSNKLLASIKLFHSIISSDWFPRSQIFLFLNKSDLLKEKLEAGKSIQTSFPTYTGDNSVESVSSFLQKEFLNVTDPKTGKPPSIPTYHVVAIDSENVKFNFGVLKTAMLQEPPRMKGL